MSISYNDVATQLRALAAERPDYVYLAPEHQVEQSVPGSCFYVHTDEDGSNAQPGCIVGHVLNRLGVPLEDMAQHEGKGAFSLVRRLGLDIDDNAAYSLADVQEAQDKGTPWGDAVEVNL